MSLSDRFRKFFATHPGPRAVPTINPATFDGPFISPGTPVTSEFAAVEPRYFDYISGVNANIQPRTEYSDLIPTFRQLWLTYLNCDVLRVATTHRTQAILSLSWNLKTKKGSGSRSERGLEEVRRLLDRPDPQNGYNFEGWLRSCCEESYVTDALTIYPVRNRLKRVVALMQIDGQTIKPLIDYARGGIPAPPDAAFIQYIKGVPYTAFTSEQIVYSPFRPRVWCIYGQSRVENVLATMQEYLLHDSWVSDYFQQGNIPEAALLTDPVQSDLADEGKFIEWQKLMDEQAGMNVTRRRVHLMPNFVKSLQMLKSFSFDKELPSWLVRILCVEYGMPSYMFVSETNKATAKEINKTLYEAPHRQELMSLKRWIENLLSVSGYPETEFNWSKDLDYSEEAVKGLVMLTTAPPGSAEKPILSRSEAREYFGLDPDSDDDAASEDTESEGGFESEDTVEPEGGVAKSRLRVVKSVPRVAGKKGRRFTGPGGNLKARVATGMAGVVYKRSRQQLSAIIRQGIERAKARQKKVVGT